MATVQIILATSTSRMQVQPVLDTAVVAKDTITSSGTSQPSTATASSLNAYDEYWAIAASGGAVWVTFAVAPVAAAGTDWLVPDGQTVYWRARPGDKAAVIDAA